jgi:FixJ family two-component response regulator
MPRLPHISIIDDDDALRSSLENLIRSVGLRVQGFSSAESFLSSNQAPETHCLILDVRMPGMSGLELQRQMAVANSLLVIAPITERSILRRTNSVVLVVNFAASERIRPSTCKVLLWESLRVATL